MLPRRPARYQLQQLLVATSQKIPSDLLSPSQHLLKTVHWTNSTELLDRLYTTIQPLPFPPQPPPPPSSFSTCFLIG